MGKEFLDEDDEFDELLALIRGGQIIVEEVDEDEIENSDGNETVLFVGFVPDDEEDVEEAVLYKDDKKNPKGKNKNSGLTITCDIDSEMTSRNFSKNNAYFKVYNGDRTNRETAIIRLHVCDANYEVHEGGKGGGYKQWYKTITNKDYENIKKALEKPCTEGRYKGMTTYDAIIAMYKSINVDLENNGIPDYSTENSKRATSVHDKNRR